MLVLTYLGKMHLDHCRAAETGECCTFLRVSLHEFYSVLIERMEESAEKVSLQGQRWGQGRAANDGG